MKTKNFGLFFVTILSLFLFMNVVSAGNLSSVWVSKPTSVVNNAGSFPMSFNVTNTGSATNVSLTYTITQGTATITFSLGPNNISFSENETKQISGTVTFSSQVGPIAGTIIATPITGTSFNLPFSVALTALQQDFLDNFCLFEDGNSSNPGDLRVRVKDIVVTGLGDDDQWVPFDEIEVEVEVANRGSDDVDNVAIEWGLYNEEDNEWVIEVDEEDELNLGDDDEETITFSFILDDDLDQNLDELADGNHYILFVRAVGEVDTSSSPDTCHSEREEIEIIIERDFIKLTDLEAPETVSCGSNLLVTGRLWNIGLDNQDEVSVLATVNGLEFSRVFEIGDIDTFENERVDLEIPIQRNAQEGSYTIIFEVLDENEDIFEGDFADDNVEAKFSRIFTVLGGCSTSPEGEQQDNVLVSASLESGGKAGESMVVRAVITNTGDSGVFLINAAEFASWANSADVDKETLSIPRDGTGVVLFTFDVKDGISGDQMFNIEVVSDSELVASQPVSVSIESRQSVGLDGIFGDNWYLWLIGLLNLVLVIIIIIVAVRVSRK